MKVYHLKFKFIYISSIFFFVVCCNGQNETKSQNVTSPNLNTLTSKKSKLTKTQGSDSAQNVHCSLQDKFGNMWFGTTGDGVFKFDGEFFTQFTSESGLANNKVWSILEDENGNIWFGTDSGVSRFNGESIVEVPIILNNDSPSVQANKKIVTAVWSMLQDRNGTIWLGTSEDLYCYDGASFRRFLDNYNITNENNLNLKWIQCILEDNHGNMWFGSGPIAMEGVCHYNGKKVTNFMPNGDGWIRNIVQSKDGLIWFGGRSNGIFTFNGTEFTNFMKNDVGCPALIDSAGNIWFTGNEKPTTNESENGIWRYDGKDFINYDSKDGLGKYYTFSITEDKHGNIWVGTRNTGLYKYSGEKFESYSH